MAKLQTLVRLPEFHNLAVLPHTIARFDVMDTGSSRCLELSWLPTDTGELIIVQRDANKDSFFAVTLQCNGTHAPMRYILPKLGHVTHIEVLASCPVTILELALSNWEGAAANALTYAGLQVRGSDSFTVKDSQEGSTAFLQCGRFGSVALSLPRIVTGGSFYTFLLATYGMVTMLLPGAMRATLKGSIVGVWPTSNFATSVARVAENAVPFELMLAENAVYSDNSTGVAYAAQRRIINL